jgi:hypothetical protein
MAKEIKLCPNSLNKKVFVQSFSVTLKRFFELGVIKTMSKRLKGAIKIRVNFSSG